MVKNIAIFGSTGSVGKSSLEVLNKNSDYKIILLTTNSNVLKIYKQAIKFNVKNIIIEDAIKFKNYKKIFKKKCINL